MELKKKIEAVVKKSLRELNFGEDFPIQLEIPTDIKHGDYTSNVALRAFGVSKINPTGINESKNPIEMAEKIIKIITGYPEVNNLIEKIEAAQPGFINFWISKGILIKKVEEILEKPKDFGKTDEMEGKKIAVEFTDPNPFKEFHIGHVYTNTVGEAMSRIFESNGAVVWRADYFGDVGMHVAKSLFGLEKKLKQDNISFENLGNKTLSEKIKYLGQAYALGSSLYDKDSSISDQVKTINKLVYIAAQKMWQKEKDIVPEIDYLKGSEIDKVQFERIYDLYTIGRSWSLEYFDSLYKRLGMHFDGYYPESIAGEKGFALVKKHISDGVFVESDGAVIFEGGKQGLHTRVFINSLGLPTYEAKELGLAPWKFEDFPYDVSIIVTGSEIKEYFKVLIAAMLAVEPELGKKTTHLPHGMVRLPEGKMSSRTGKIITGEWLLDEAKKKVMEHFNKTDSSAEAKEQIAEQVGIGAIKYTFLKSGIGKDIEFDFESSLSFDGASGPYLQYSYVRTQSILEKWKRMGTKVNKLEKNQKNELARSFPSVRVNSDELLLLRKMRQFEEMIAKAGEKYAPSVICEYLFELAQYFSGFYQNNRIIDAKTDSERDFRLKITQALGVIFERGLYLLGIVAPKRM